MIKIISDISEMQAYSKLKRFEGKKIGLVPTMGALHQGHLSLITRALEKADIVVVSIFVNPIQFGPKEDFKRYPRVIESDVKLTEKTGAHVVFTPDADKMYPEGYSTYISVEKVSERLCGKYRPGHFTGVASVVAKLFNIVMPDIAIFGQKDAQQLAVIRRMTTDLNMGIEIIGAPIIRELDSLAMSSRNRYLDDEERKQAAVIYKSLNEAEKFFKSGVKNSGEIIKIVEKIIKESTLAKIEYIEIVDPVFITPLDEIDKKALLAVCVRIGNTRLIDNIILEEVN